MMAIEAIAPVLLSQPAVNMLGVGSVAATPPVGFGEILAAGMRGVETKLSGADDLVRRFTLGETIPVHQVTYALEEARLSVELAMQVRGRLLEGYRELMNMQL